MSACLVYLVGGHCISKYLPNIPNYLGGARRTWPLTGLAERSAVFQAHTTDARSGHVSAPTRPQPQNAESSQRTAVSEHALPALLGQHFLGARVEVLPHVPLPEEFAPLVYLSLP